jgi:hypothetical protein
MKKIVNFNNFKKLIKQKREYSNALPFKAGYSMGSIISEEVLNDLKEEAKLKSQISKFENVYNELEIMKKRYTLKKNKLVNDQNSDQTTKENNSTNQKSLDKILQNQIKVQQSLDAANDAYVDYKINNSLKELGDNMVIDTESPLDFNISKQSIEPKGFDTVTLSSDFLSSTNNEETMANLKSKFSSYFGSSYLGSGASVASTVAANLSNSQQSKSIEATMIISCFATTRNVRTMLPIVVDPAKVLRIWRKKFNAYPMLNDHKTQINVITETVMGATLVGFVHFLSTDKSRTSQANFSSVYEQQAEIGGFLARMIGVSGVTKQARENSAKFADLISSTGLQTQFELFS